MGFPISNDALDDRIAFVGTAGSGKTYNACAAVERLLERKARVVIVDPLGAWWGLRLASDGKKASPFPVVIFGGRHGDLPLTEHAGALIGETVAGTAEPCILDLSEIGTKAGERRFMLGFLTALYRKTNGSQLHLVIDEADMFAPQRLLDRDGDAARLLGQMETIVRRGRIKGFVPWLITQRPAVISKDVLSQADGLVAFKLTSSQDRDAIGGWIEGQADKSEGKAILASLPTMARGQAVVWMPGRGILKTEQFPLKSTFDSSRTPKRGDEVKETTLAALDIGALRSKLATVEAETKANDPRELKAEIAKLKAELARAQKSPPSNIKEIEAAEQRGREVGFDDAYARGLRAINDLWSSLLKPISAIKDGFNEIEIIHEQLFTAIEGRDVKAPSILDLPISHYERVAKKQPVGVTPKVGLEMRHQPTQKPRAPGAHVPNGKFSQPQNRVIRALSMWLALGHEAPSREMVAAASGYSPSSGGFNNLIGSLCTIGAVDKPATGCLRLLDPHETGMTREDGREMLLRTLSNPQRKIVDALIGAGARGREEVAADTDYSPTSGGFNNLIGSLSTLNILVKPAPGRVALSEWAQELLER
jgi:hypothetical protein